MAVELVKSNVGNRRFIVKHSMDFFGVWSKMLVKIVDRSNKNSQKLPSRVIVSDISRRAVLKATAYGKAGMSMNSPPHPGEPSFT